MGSNMCTLRKSNTVKEMATATGPFAAAVAAVTVEDDRNDKSNHCVSRCGIFGASKKS